MMRVRIDTKSLNQILKKRGLEDGGKVQKFFTNTVYKYSDPYTPFQNGIFKENVEIKADSIKYRSPQASFLWNGLLMVDPETGSAYARKGVSKVLAQPQIALNYNQAPMRGKKWTLRMWQDRKDDILDQTAKIAGGRAK